MQRGQDALSISKYPDSPSPHSSDLFIYPTACLLCSFCVFSTHPVCSCHVSVSYISNETFTVLLKKNKTAVIYLNKGSNCIKWPCVLFCLQRSVGLSIRRKPYMKLTSQWRWPVHPNLVSLHTFVGLLENASSHPLSTKVLRGSWIAQLPSEYSRALKEANWERQPWPEGREAKLLLWLHTCVTVFMKCVELAPT